MCVLMFSTTPRMGMPTFCSNCGREGDRDGRRGRYASIERQTMAQERVGGGGLALPPQGSREVEHGPRDFGAIPRSLAQKGEGFVVKRFRRRVMGLVEENMAQSPEALRDIGVGV